MRSKFSFLYVDIWLNVTKCKFIVKNSSFEMLVVFSSIFVADTKITFVCNFVAPLSNLFFNFFIKMKNKKRTVLCFPFSYENEKRMKLFKNSKKKSIKHGNGSHLFEFCLSY